MLSAEAAIHRTRRDLTLGLALKALLTALLAMSFMVGPESVRLGLLLGVGAIWIFLSFTSARGSRLAAESPSLIAEGRFEEAERQIDQAIRSFSLYRAAKLQPLHHLALLRHAQRRWQESALLCRAFLGQRGATARGLSNPARLILADALLELGEVRGAYEAIDRLYREPLSLADLLNLLLLQLDYSARIGAWDAMLQGFMTKVQLAELMLPDGSARANALLALAAHKRGRADWAAWLRGRAELLGDVDHLIAQRPVFKELWPDRKP